MSLAELIKETDSLTDKEKAKLALVLIESLDGKPSEQHEELWRKEILGRDQEIEDGTAKLVSWAEIENRYK